VKAAQGAGSLFSAYPVGNFVLYDALVLRRILITSTFNTMGNVVDAQ
jgi:hypothetical protein